MTGSFLNEEDRLTVIQYSSFMNSSWYRLRKTTFRLLSVPHTSIIFRILSGVSFYEHSFSKDAETENKNHFWYIKLGKVMNFWGLSHLLNELICPKFQPFIAV